MTLKQILFSLVAAGRSCWTRRLHVLPSHFPGPLLVPVLRASRRAPERVGHCG